MTGPIDDCIEAKDPRLNRIVDAAASLEPLLEDHSAFFEGPAWVDEADGGHLLFTDIAGDAIRRWDAHNGVGAVWTDFFSRSPNARSRVIELPDRRAELRGPDGLALDAEGRIVYCGYGPRHVGRIERDGSVTILASSFDGHLLNTPNDVIVSRSGAVYFTDSSAGVAIEGDDKANGAPSSALYRLGPEGLERLHDDFVAANGLAFSPDESHLYVNDTRRMVVWRFDVTRDGRLSNRVEFVHMGIDRSDGHPDGMKVDTAGNLYVTGPGGLWILAPDGSHLGTIRTPERLTNLAFGEADRDALFIAAPSFLWRVRMRSRGLRSAIPPD